MRLTYELSVDAEKDLREVARYTLDKWGKEALQKSRHGLRNSFEAISKGTVQARVFSESFPQLSVLKYEYHYIFYLSGNREKPIIIGVIHERRDVVNRLSERLK